MNMQWDCHVHCGQYEQTYYQPAYVIRSLHRNGIKSVWLSSTTSNIEWGNAEEKRILIQHVEDELLEALAVANECKVEVKPLYWVIPKRADEGESIDSIMSQFPYAGFKVHTRLPGWELSNTNVLGLFEEICKYADEHQMPVLIHTGVDPVDLPNRFNPFYSAFPNVQFVLAHCKAQDSIINLFRNYQNVYGDCSFCPEQSFRKICDAGFKDRMLWGTDFPVTQWYIDPEESSQNELAESYQKVLACQKALLKY